MSFIQNQIGLKGSGGSIYMNNAAAPITVSVTASYQELTSLSTSFSLATTSPDFAMTTDGRLKYTGIITKNFVVNATINISTASTGSSAMQIYKNGSATGIECYESVIPSLSIQKAPVSLATNDYISIFFKASSTTTRLVSSITLSIISMSEA